MDSETPYSTPELEVKELPPMESPVHNAQAPRCSPPPEAPLLIIPGETATAAASLKPTEQGPLIPAVPATEKQQQQQPAVAAVSPLMGRKSTLLKTAPRVPSTLRKVVDVRSVETLNSQVGAAKDVRQPDEGAVHSEGDLSSQVPPSTGVDASTSEQIQRRPPNVAASLSPVLVTSASTPMLRNLNEPTLMHLIDRSSDEDTVLPHPHQMMDGLHMRQRPHSLNTLNSSSCRLSIITIDQDYQEYSYKNNSQRVVRPSVIRGWMRRFGGKMKYSFGQLFASPSLILDGNRDIARGTAQMNLSRHRRTSAPGAQSESRRLSRTLTRKSTTKSTQGSDTSAEAHESKHKRTKSQTQALQTGRRVSWGENSDGTRPHSMDGKLRQKPRMSVIEMAALAADTAVEMELDSLSQALASRNASRANSVYPPVPAIPASANTPGSMRSIRSNSETTDVSTNVSRTASSPAISSSNKSEGTVVPGSPADSRILGSSDMSPSAEKTCVSLTSSSSISSAGIEEPVTMRRHMVAARAPTALTA
ncbi:hypothetical protein EC988_000674 [Linderina pennispora]|nr:hypothetical protein EC988_000674 [Linderina pennispora]